MQLIDGLDLVLIHQIRFDNSNNSVVKHFASINTKHKVYMIEVPYKILNYKIPYLRDQSSNIRCVSKSVFTAIEKSCTCSHFSDVIDWWSVLRENKIKVTMNFDPIPLREMNLHTNLAAFISALTRTSLIRPTKKVHVLVEVLGSTNSCSNTRKSFFVRGQTLKFHRRKNTPPIVSSIVGLCTW